jgi:hypothetical protein
MPQQVTASPSWRSLRVRSSSLPRVRLTRRNSLSNREDQQSSNDVVGSGVRSWAKNWLSGATSPSRQVASPTNVDFQVDPGSPLSPPLRKRSLRRTPVLTLALLKLDEQLLSYCLYLCDPSYDNVAAACALLDSTVATASPANSDRGGSPASFVGSPSEQRSSPSRSPIRSWLSGGGSLKSPPNIKSAVSSSAACMHSEWEKIIAPLFLLAGAEAIYSSLGQAHSSVVANNVIGLYQRIAKELRLVRETLCDPFLDTGEEKLAPTLVMYCQKATSLAASLHALVILAQSRCQLVQLQYSMWEASEPKFEEFTDLFDGVLPHFPIEGFRATPMMNALVQEVLAWKHLTQTAFTLERCRYVRKVARVCRLIAVMYCEVPHC